MQHDQIPPSIDTIAEIAEKILGQLPEPFKSLLREIPIRIEDWPSDEILDDMAIEDPLSLTGLYRGTPIGERATMTTPIEPEMIFLFRLPILFEWCEQGMTLEEIVFDVLTHEIGHHFGMDEVAVLRMEGRDP